MITLNITAEELASFSKVVSEVLGQAPGKSIAVYGDASTTLILTTTPQAQLVVSAITTGQATPPVEAPIAWQPEVVAPAAEEAPAEAASTSQQPEALPEAGSSPEAPADESLAAAEPPVEPSPEVPPTV